jgi:hypothetical protein
MADHSQSSLEVQALFERRLRTLAKNMIAISNGNGRPSGLVEQIVEVAESLIAFDKAFGMRPQAEFIQRALADAHDKE